MKRVFTLTLTGLGYAFIFLAIFTYGYYLLVGDTISINQLAKNMFSIGLLGMIYVWINLIYEIEHWSLLKQTSLHYFIFLISSLSFALWNQWIPINPGPIILFVLIFTFNYIIIWFAIKTYWKIKIKQLNQSLQKRK